MREANTDLQNAGGASLPDAALIALLDAAIARCTAYDQITGISRLESFSGAKPDLRYLHAFGCSVEAYLGNEQRYAADRKRDLSLGEN